MENENDVIVGLEVHVQLNTKSKLFCSCPNEAEKPNTATCPVCLGMPGSKPKLNKKVVDYAIELCLALNCKIQPQIVFSRKTYFYPDMSKNYQITQYEIPLGKLGKIKLKSGKELNLTRVHVEEDPARLVHESGIHSSEYTLMDYNRSGIPLCEIVTEPELSSPEEARDFLNRLIAILNYLGIFDIEKCTIKADSNISLKGHERVEIKNISGFKEVERALSYEITRQRNMLRRGLNIERETRAWDDISGTTKPLRKKETEDDYGYIIDSDLVPTEVTQSWVKEIEKNLPEFSDAKVKRFIKQYKIKQDDAEIIAADPLIANLFEKVASKVNPELSAKWIRRELMRVLNYNCKEIYETKINETHLIDLLSLIDSRKITDRIGQKIIEKLVEKPFDIKDYVKKESLAAVSDESQLKKFCEEAVKENKEAVEDYKKGEEKALNFIVGSVMKKTRGKATPAEVNKILKEIIH